MEFDASATLDLLHALIVLRETSLDVSADVGCVLLHFAHLSIRVGLDFATVKPSHDVLDEPHGVGPSCRGGCFPFSSDLRHSSILVPSRSMRVCVASAMPTALFSAAMS
jgi:hypothetical protein